MPENSKGGEILGEVAIKDLYSNLIDASRVLGNKRMIRIISKSAKDTAKDVIRSKIISIEIFITSTVNGTKRVINAFKKDGLKGVGKLFLNKAERLIYDVKNFSSELVDDFKNDRKSFLRKVSKIAVFSTAALIYAGGFDLEGGVPDTDLKFGIGHHRNIVSHTIILPLFIEFSIRFILNIAEEMVKEGHEGVWRKLYDFKKEYSDVLIGGLWFGAMMHLFKDSAPFSDRTKPLTGLHGLSMETHKRILSASSALAGIFSYEALKKRKDT